MNGIKNEDKKFYITWICKFFIIHFFCNRTKSWIKRDTKQKKRLQFINSILVFFQRSIKYLYDTMHNLSISTHISTNYLKTIWIDGCNFFFWLAWLDVPKFILVFISDIWFLLFRLLNCLLVNYLIILPCQSILAFSLLVNSFHSLSYSVYIFSLSLVPFCVLFFSPN